MSVSKACARPRNVFVHRRLAYRLSLEAPVLRRSLSSTPAQPSQFGPPMDRSTHSCDIDAEPLHRYHKGGYHPVHLGDHLSDGRYKILQKLGWGGYSTVWAARDMRSRFL